MSSITRQLRHWVECLGWNGLNKFTHALPKGHTLPSAKRRVVWYESGDFDTVLLQINIGRKACAAVFATRYKICSGWHRFRLYPTAARRRSEADRLAEWLHLHWFDTAKGRRAYRQLHPECGDYTLARLRAEGPPYPQNIN